MATRMAASGVPESKSVRRRETEKREQIINADISAIDEAIASNGEAKMKAVHIEMDGKYSAVIPNIGQGMRRYSLKYGFQYSQLDGWSIEHNLTLMKAKLRGYLNGFPTQAPLGAPQNNINVSTAITNEININISFEEAKQKIEEMPGLTDSETEEIKNKIAALEDISNESISRKKKWEKAKPILSFALDKGVDVAITIMGLILQMKLGM